MRDLLDRRMFLRTAGAATLLAGCRTRAFLGEPELTFGVVSDIHVTTPASARLFERALRFFRRQGADAVMVPGDLTDWGLLSGFRFVRETWDRVFAGTEVVPLFVTGNHEYDGWRYPDMAMEMLANGYSEDEALVRRGGMAACWREAFGEPFAAIRCRTVKGYSFVSGEWQGSGELADWMAKNGAALKGGKPFFYFQHAPITDTTCDSLAEWGRNSAKAVLEAYPNCIAFTGHAHRPFFDERMIWQGSFTAIASPSLSYACLEEGFENGPGLRNGKVAKAMPELPLRCDLKGGQGYLVRVGRDRVEVERWDLAEEAVAAPAWILPLNGERPHSFERRARTEPVPRFPAAASLGLETRNATDRTGGWAIVLDCTFPSAEMPEGSRVYAYEIRAVRPDGSTAFVRRFFSPAVASPAKDEPARQRFWFNVADLPQDADYRIEVRACNCFGRAGDPLVSSVRHGRSGLATVKTENDRGLHK